MENSRYHCICGVNLSPYSIGTHLKSKSHIDIITLKKEIIELKKEVLSLKKNKMDLEIELSKK